MAEGDRSRRIAGKRNARLPHVAFQNPYPWMSATEARVHLELERRRVPFSWRYFDGDSPTLKELLPDFAPEFTLREYKLVILIIGGYWGLLPSVLDINALAQAALEFDGWAVATLFEAEIVADVAKAINDKCPMLGAPAITGAKRPNPYGNVDLISRLRTRLSGQGLSRRKFTLERQDASLRHGRRTAGSARSESGNRRRSKFRGRIG